MGNYSLVFGQCYHFFQMGNHRRALFQEDQDYEYFLDLYRKYLRPVAELYAYCLLPTHFHLLFRIKDHHQVEYVYPEEGMLGWQLRTLLVVYTKNINQATRDSGPMLDGGSAREVPDQQDLLCKLVAYIHQNPQIHGMVSDFRFWPYSSCFAYLRQDRRSLIAKDLLLDPAFRRRLLELQNNHCLRERDWEWMK